MNLFSSHDSWARSALLLKVMGLVILFLLTLRFLRWPFTTIVLVHTIVEFTFAIVFLVTSKYIKKKNEPALLVGSSIYGVDTLLTVILMIPSFHWSAIPSIVLRVLIIFLIAFPSPKFQRLVIWAKSKIEAIVRAASVKY